MTEPSIAERIPVILLIEDACERNRELRELAALEDAKSMEAFDAIIPFLTHANEKVCRRAGSALGKFPTQVEQRVAVVIDHLLHNPNPTVRQSCAITLMKNLSAPVTAAYRCALDDSSDRVVQIACVELGFRGGAENGEALMRILSHNSWRVRLEACKALITHGTADQRVVKTLEAMDREPEARIYDTECDDLELIVQETTRQSGEPLPCKMWGKLNTILEQARSLARSERST